MNLEALWFNMRSVCSLPWSGNRWSSAAAAPACLGSRPGCLHNKRGSLSQLTHNTNASQGAALLFFPRPSGGFCFCYLRGTKGCRQNGRRRWLPWRQTLAPWRSWLAWSCLPAGGMRISHKTQKTWWRTRVWGTQRFSLLFDVTNAPLCVLNVQKVIQL